MDLLKAFKAAAGTRRYIIGAVCVGVIGAVDWIYAKLKAANMMTELIGLPSWVIATWVAAGFVIYWLLDHAVKLQRRMGGARVELSNLRAEGVEIRNTGRHKFADEPSYLAWKKSVIDWEANVVAAISKVNEADAEWFKVLDVVPIPARLPFYKKHDPEDLHELHYRMHDCRLDRLGKMILNLWRE